MNKFIIIISFFMCFLIYKYCSWECFHQFLINYQDMGPGNPGIPVDADDTSKSIEDIQTADKKAIFESERRPDRFYWSPPVHHRYSKMSNCPGTRIRYGAERKCDLHPSSKYPDAAKKDPGEIDRCRPYKLPPPPPPEDCDWRRYLLYAIPLMLYIPWAIGKMRCKSKCCPAASCCPRVKCKPEQNTCCPPDPVKCDEDYQLKQQKDFRCGADKKSCGESDE